MVEACDPHFSPYLISSFSFSQCQANFAFGLLRVNVGLVYIYSDLVWMFTFL